MSEYTPVEYLTKIQKLKYKAAIFPILLVIISFGLNMIYQLDQVKYLSILGLIWYILIIIRFRIRRNVPPKNESEIILSPIYGTITKIDINMITIKKGLFQAADIRYPGYEINLKFTSKFINLFEKKPNLAGKLIGVVSCKSKCVCTIPDDWNINVHPGDKVIAGETILAAK